MLCCACIYDVIVVESQSSADVGNLISDDIIAGSYTTIRVSFLFKYSRIDIVGRRSESGVRAESGEITYSTNLSMNASEDRPTALVREMGGGGV